jgi:DNA-binding NarL/FixJ family response regulator
VTTVLLCDDEALVRAGLRMILGAQSEIEVVGEAVDGGDAVRQCRDLRPDVVLMDIRMPNLDGIEATRRILADPVAGRTAVVVLTTFDADDHIFDALDAGACGFLLKSAPPDELVRAVRRAAGGDLLLAPEVTRRLVADFLQRPPRGTPPPTLSTLTAREVEVLTLIGRGCTNAEIAGQLFLGEATVKTHVNRIFSKLGVRDRAQAVVAAYEGGLVMPGGKEVQ